MIAKYSFRDRLIYIFITEHFLKGHYDQLYIKFIIVVLLKSKIITLIKQYLALRK